MQLQEKLIKPIVEVNYLNVDNTDRYRTIVRYFFDQYEKLKYWLYQEEVYEHLRSFSYFENYTSDQCAGDLAALVNWKNLFTMQDTRKVSTLEEFKNKKFRYQLSEYTVEIERMVIKLENLFVEGASLEPTLLERIGQHLDKILPISEKDISEVYTWWSDLNSDFVRLNQNYQDYMRDLNSLRAEEMMQTREFLIFKDQLIEYLRGFVKGLQLNVGAIEQKLKKVLPQTLELIYEKVLQYELSIPRLEVEVDRERIQENIHGRFKSIQEWFVDTSGVGAESEKVFDMTNEVIRKITRYATRISEHSSGANRKEEYEKIAAMFGKCKNIKEAHKLSAMVFGIESPMHLKGEFIRETESVNSGVYDENPLEIMIRPRIRAYGEKSRRSSIIDRSKEKEAMRLKELERIERENNLVKGYIKDNQIDFSRLPVIEPEVRATLLSWLSRGFENKNKKGKTQDGRTFVIIQAEGNERCLLKCTDGTFDMPRCIIRFSPAEEVPVVFAATEEV